MYEVLNQKDKVFCRIGDELTYMIFPNAADGVTIRIQKRENWYDDKDWNGGTVSAPVTMEEYESLTVHEINVIFNTLKNFAIYLTEPDEKANLSVKITDRQIHMFGVFNQGAVRRMKEFRYKRMREKVRKLQICGR